MNGDVEFWSQLTSDLTGGLTPEQLAQQQLEEAKGAGGAFAASVAEGAVPVVGTPLRKAVQGSPLYEQQRADYPFISTLGEGIGSILPTALASKGAQAAAKTPLGKRLGEFSSDYIDMALQGLLGGATTAAKGGDIYDVGLAGLLGTGMSLLGAGAKGQSVKQEAKAMERALAPVRKTPEYGQAVKDLSAAGTRLKNAEEKLITLRGDLGAETAVARRRAQDNIGKLKSEYEKLGKDLDALRVKSQQAAPTDRTSPEYQTWKQSDDEVKRLQKQLDLAKAQLRNLEATAPTKLSAERERGIAAAQRDVVKAEERVFSAEEKAELQDALRKLMAQEEGDIAAAGAAKARNEALKRQQAKKTAEAKPTEPEVAAPIEEEPMKFGRDFSQREIELLEDFWASGKGLRDIGAEIKMDKSTLSRRLKAHGVTKESAKANAAKRAAERAELEAAAQDIVPEPTPAPAPEPKPQMEPIPSVRQAPLTAAERRELQQEEVLGPIRQEAELGRYGRAQERLGAAEAAPVPALAESRFGAEAATRQQQIQGLEQEFSKAVQIRDDALAMLQQARSPEARAALQQQVQGAEQAATQKAQQIDDALKAFEEESFLADLKTPSKISSQEQIVSRAQVGLDEAQAAIDQLRNVSPEGKRMLRAALRAAGSPLGRQVMKMVTAPTASELTDEDVKAVLTNQ